jgi:hypothetical protein
MGRGHPQGTVRSRLEPILLVAVAVALVACGTTFDPSGPCTQDGRVAGAYPELEALVPASFQGRGPDQLDSGRSCTRGALGPLADRGIEELRFAGGLWRTGSQSGITLAVFRATGLEAEAMLEFYRSGAGGSRRIERLTTGEVRRGSRVLLRLDALNDASDQSILVWQDGDLVRAVLVADSVSEVSSKADHERRVTEALAAAGV